MGHPRLWQFQRRERKSPNPTLARGGLVWGNHFFGGFQHERAPEQPQLSGDSGGLRARQALVDGFSDRANSALLIYAVAINYPRKTDQERTSLWLM